MKSNQTPESLYSVIKRIVQGPVQALMTDVFGASPASKPLAVEVLEYVNVLEYAAEVRAEDRRVVATLLKREPTPEGWAVIQVFMDEKNELIRKGGGMFGRQFLAKSLDPELLDFFGDGESVVIELP